MRHDSEWRQRVSVERDLYIVLLHMSSLSQSAPIVAWTPDQIVRDLCLPRERAELVLSTLSRTGFLRPLESGEGLALTWRGSDYVARGSGRRRSLRLPPSAIQEPGEFRDDRTEDSVPRQRDLKSEARERLQYKVLSWLHHQVGTDCREVVSAIGLARHFNASLKEVYAAIEDLARHGLVGYHGAGPRVCITRKGLQHLEGAQRRRSVRIRRD